jgi:hypothetical protein
VEELGGGRDFLALVGGFSLVLFAFGLGRVQFLREDIGADIHALVADVNTGTGDEFFDL